MGGIGDRARQSCTPLADGRRTPWRANDPGRKRISSPHFLRRDMRQPLSYYSQTVIETRRVGWSRMKLTVNRQLAGGSYFVSFSVGDFSEEEKQKMESFGIPGIALQILNPQQGIVKPLTVPITGINLQMKGRFKSQEEAAQYEEGVRTQISKAIEWLRDRKDTFTSTDEVTL